MKIIQLIVPNVPIADTMFYGLSDGGEVYVFKHIGGGRYAWFKVASSTDVWNPE